MTNKPLRSRIAPTPSGYLHLGNIFNFMLTYLWVKKHGGILQLRIDDIDKSRSRKEYVEDIFYVLEWLGISYDEGPSGPDEFYQKYSQQLRLDIYSQALEQLWEQQKLFTCTCSRSHIKALSKDGQYPGICRNASHPKETLQSALRIRTPQNSLISWSDICMGQVSVNLFQEMRDFVVRRKDGLPAYQLVSLLEDEKSNINFIIRGEDLKVSTAAQLFLSSHFSSPSFSHIQFLHHPLFTNSTHQKLSKSAGAMAMRTWIKKWKSPLPCYKWIAKVLDLSPQEISNLDDLISQFQPNNLQIIPTQPTFN